MKVLVVIDSMSFGGAEHLLAVLAEGRREGLDMSVLALPDRSDPRTQMLPVLEAAGLTVEFAGVSRLLQPSALARLVRAIRRSGCDVVHAHLGYSSILAPVAARLAGVPCVATLHHVPGRTARGEAVKERLMVAVPSRLGRLVFVSAASRDAFATRYRPRPTWRVVHNGIDVERFSGEVAPADLGVPAGAPVVSIVAAVREPKGHEVAIRSWPRVRASVPDARLVVVGDGPHRGALEELTRELGQDDRVVFVGSRSDVPEVWAASTLAALPSYTEALPTALIEAGAAGLACVATRVGGVPEVVEDGVTGVLVPPHEVDAFADAVVALLLDHPRRAAYGRAARELTQSRFDREVWTDRLLDLYADALGRASGTSRPALRGGGTGD